MPRARALPAAVLALLVGALAPAPARAGDPPPPPPTAPAPRPIDIARKESVERLSKDLRRMARGARAEKDKAEILKDLDALKTLAGVDGAHAALEALAFDDEETEKAVFEQVETCRDKSLLKPLAAMIEDKDTRRRFRLHAQIAHAFAAIADPAALEPLTELVRSEDAHVVAAAADALAGFRSAPHAKRVEPVRRLVDVFESTYNLKESIRAEDRIQSDRAKDQWEVYGAAVRKALQSLTGQSQLSSSRQFRDWWNEHKKATNW